jgi:proteasome accessory factor B
MVVSSSRFDSILIEIRSLPTEAGYCNSDKDFHPAKYLEHSFGIFTEERAPQTIRVRFAPKVVRILQEKKFHSSQQLIHKRDGSVIAGYQLTGFEEIRPWILSFGRHARVLEPAELVESIRDELDLMINVYTLGDRTYD